MYSTLLTTLPYLPLLPVLIITLQQKSFMMSLLYLEIMILTLVLVSAATIGGGNMKEPYLCLILLVFGACEASLGLSIMVAILRSWGNMNTKTLTFSKC